MKFKNQDFFIQNFNFKINPLKKYLYSIIILAILFMNIKLHNLIDIKKFIIFLLLFLLDFYLQHFYIIDQYNIIVKYGTLIHQKIVNKNGKKYKIKKS